MQESYFLSFSLSLSLFLSLCVHDSGMLAFKRQEVQIQIQQSDVVELVRSALASNPGAVGLAENGQALLSSLWMAGSSSASSSGASSSSEATPTRSHVGGVPSVPGSVGSVGSYGSSRRGRKFAGDV